MRGLEWIFRPWYSLGGYICFFSNVSLCVLVLSPEVRIKHDKKTDRQSIRENEEKNTYLSVPKQTIFQKISRGGHFQAKIYIADFGPLNRTFWAWNWYKTFNCFAANKKKWDMIFRRGGGSQRPFGTFPKIYPFWYRHPSLRGVTYNHNCAVCIALHK